MIPSFEVPLAVEVDPSVLTVPGKAVLSAKRYLAANRFYSYLGPISWNEFDEVYEYEGDLISEADSMSKTPEEFEDAIYDLDGEGALGELDVGIASPVYALYASGFFPFTSCRGHPHGVGTRDCPKVVFWCPKRRVAHLVEAAKVARVGLANEPTGNGVGLMLYARDILELRRFALQLSESGRR